MVQRRVSHYDWLVTLILATLSLFTIVVIFAWFVSLEKRGDAVVTVAIILGLLVVEVAIYDNQNTIPTGLFHPAIGGESMRLHEVLIPLALLARLVARGVPSVISTTSLAWAAFIAWLLTAAVMGRVGGNAPNLVTYESKAAIYIGAFVLAAGVSASDYLDRRPIKVVIVLAAVLASLIDLLALTGTRIYTALPGIPLPTDFDPLTQSTFHYGFGAVGADTATIFFSLAIILFAYAMTKSSGRASAIALAVPLAAAGVLSNQRAAVLGIAASVATLAFLAALRQDRIRLTSAQVVIAAGVVAAAFVLPTFSTAALGSPNPTIPLAGAYEQTFGGEGNERTTQDRYNQWSNARGLIEQQPIFGWGLGKVYIFYDEGTRTLKTTHLTHNIGLDLLVRTGIVGLVFFLVALCISLAGGVRAWREHGDDRIAALAAGCVAVVVGLVAKGMVESIFEKYRLAVFLGLSLGVLLSTAASLERSPRGAAAAQGRS
jgi:O-antigen ligase